MKTLIKNGLLIDPHNRVMGNLNLLIEDGKVAGVSREEEAADLTIDAKGMIVAPGFIDIHIHEDPVIDGKIYGNEENSIFNSMLRMGVTTCLAGNCGDNLYDPGDYLDLVDRDGAAVNVAMLLGHTFLREAAGHDDKYSHVTSEELERMVALGRKALDRGCFGVSYGIRYVPGTEEKEIIALAELCRERNKIIASHIRSDAGEVFDALDEFLGVAKKLRIPAQVSHIGSMAGFGQMKEFLRRVDEYRGNGLDVSCDCYPYYAFSTAIGATTYDEGWMERYGCDYGVVEICEGKYKGMRCSKEIFDEERREHPEHLTVCYVMKEEDVDMAISHPNVMLGSDGLFSSGQGHPRGAGAFPRLFSEFVRRGKLSLYDGVAKATSMPKERLKLEGKGSLGPGDDGDVVIFDGEGIRDRASFQEPVLPPEGIAYVLINGEIAAENCKVVKGNLGRAVRK